VVNHTIKKFILRAPKPTNLYVKKEEEERVQKIDRF